jgi:pimeloyl-ACP methyl ester carboxylesterase
MCYVPRLPGRCARLRRDCAAPRQARLIVPYLRGYGPARLLSDDTSNSGDQAAFAYDLLALLDALAISKAVVGGYDWRGRACCIVSALRSERLVALIFRNMRMGTLQALETAKALGTTRADRKGDISCHVLRFQTERLFTVWSTTIYGRGSAQPRC